MPRPRQRPSKRAREPYDLVRLALNIFCLFLSPQTRIKAYELSPIPSQWNLLPRTKLSSGRLPDLPFGAGREEGKWVLGRRQGDEG